MKNKYFLVVSLAALLALGACGGNTNSRGNSKSSESSSSSSSSSGSDQKSYVDPVVDLDDYAAPNMDIAFDPIEDTCMINPKAKTYIDAMEEQEKTLDRPYHFSSLYGPDDYAKIGSAADKGDGTTYDAADTGGVDVCQILNRNDYGNDCKNYPIKLTWDDDGSFDDAKVKFWSTEDKSDIRETKVSVSNGKVTASLENLYRARKYRVQVVNGSEVSNSYEFTTGDYPRTITMGGVHNVRDLGGFVTSYGVRTTQGLIYRGYYIDDKSNGHGKNYDEEVERVHQEVMQIGVELDVQENSSSSGNYGRTTSCLGGADYKCLTLVSYENFLKQNSYKNLPEIFEMMANADEKHVYFHCWGGADRTGMLDFFLNAILGVSYTDLIEEFELTTQTNNKRCHMHNSSSAHFPKFLNAFLNGYTEGNVTFKADPNKTVNENCEKWLIEVAGVNEDDIERIREIMLPGYDRDTNKLDPNKLIPTYTAKEAWQSDALSGWQAANEDENVKCNWHRHDKKGANETCSICGYGSEGGEGQGGEGEGGEVDYLSPIGRNFSEGTPANNSDGKQYIPLSEQATGKVGVEIKFTDFSPDSTATVSGGKINPVNDKTVSLVYRIKAPKAGTYQMVMNGKVSSEGKTLNERSFAITINGASADTQGNREAGLKGDGNNDFVAVPAIALTGNEDVITVACPDNRIVFNENAYIVFIEH